MSTYNNFQDMARVEFGLTPPKEKVKNKPRKVREKISYPYMKPTHKGTFSHHSVNSLVMRAYHVNKKNNQNRVHTRLTIKQRILDNQRTKSRERLLIERLQRKQIAKQEMQENNEDFVETKEEKHDFIERFSAMVEQKTKNVVKVKPTPRKANIRSKITRFAEKE